MKLDKEVSTGAILILIGLLLIAGTLGSRAIHNRAFSQGYDAGYSDAKDEWYKRGFNKAQNIYLYGTFED